MLEPDPAKGALYVRLSAELGLWLLDRRDSQRSWIRGTLRDPA